MTEMKTCRQPEEVIRFRGQSISQMSFITGLRRLALKEVIVRFERGVGREEGRSACRGSFPNYLREGVGRRLHKFSLYACGKDLVDYTAIHIYTKSKG